MHNTSSVHSFSSLMQGQMNIMVLRDLPMHNWEIAPVSCAWESTCRCGQGQHSKSLSELGTKYSALESQIMMPCPSTASTRLHRKQCLLCTQVWSLCTPSLATSQKFDTAAHLQESCEPANSPSECADRVTPAAVHGKKWKRMLVWVWHWRVQSSRFMRKHTFCGTGTLEMT